MSEKNSFRLYLWRLEIVREFIRDRYVFSTISVVAQKGSNAAELREKEISLLTKELYFYKVLLKDLINHFPTYN